MYEGQFADLFGKQKLAALIAHEAVHNVLALFPPKFLRLRDFTEETTQAIDIAAY